MARERIKPGQPILVKSNKQFLLDPQGWTSEIFHGVKSGMVVTSMKYYQYAVPLAKFFPLDMERTARYICKVKDGELVPVFEKFIQNNPEK